MKLKSLITTILNVFSIGLLTTIVMIQNKQMSEVNLVGMNDVVKTAENNWGNLADDIFAHHELNQPFTIIDRDEKVIFQSGNTVFISLLDI